MPVKTTKDTLKMHLFNFIEKCDEKDLAKFASLALIATGVTDMSGDLTKEHKGATIQETACILRKTEAEIKKMIGTELQAHMWLGYWVVTNESIERYKQSQGMDGAKQ